MSYAKSSNKSKSKGVLHEIRRYLKHPLCLIKHKNPDPFEIGTDGRTLDYYCWRCSKVLKQVPIKDNVDFARFKKCMEEEGECLPDGEECDN